MYEGIKNKNVNDKKKKKNSKVKRTGTVKGEN